MRPDDRRRGVSACQGQVQDRHGLGVEGGRGHALLSREKSPQALSSSSPMPGGSGRSRPGESEMPPPHQSARHDVRGGADVAPGARGRVRGAEHGSFRMEDGPHWLCAPR